MRKLLVLALMLVAMAVMAGASLAESGGIVPPIRDTGTSSSTFTL